MSSWGAGGGSAGAGTGGNAKMIQGLGLDQISRVLGSNLQAVNNPAAVQPGQQANLSPQQRLAAAMRQYGAPSAPQQ